MAYRVVICAVGIYFMEDALQLLKKYCCTLHEICLRRFNTKHKSGIVRKVGSYVTWIHAPRLHFALREGLKDTSNYVDCLFDSSSEGPKNPVHLENRIEELEKELLRLQTQVSNILLKTDTKIDSKYDSNIDENVVSSSSGVQPSLPAPPPPPPPPPPPLPPTPIVQTRTLLVKVKPKSAKVSSEKDSTSTIMEELAKRPPKLRHVERSPGGRPVRSAPVSSDPSDILAAVLRKRFEAIHGEKRECYTLSPENTTKTPMITGH